MNLLNIVLSGMKKAQNDKDSVIPLHEVVKINWKPEVGMAWSGNGGVETGELFFRGYEV